jgi:hypothetical protein
LEGNIVLGQKALGLAAVRAPGGGVNGNLHIFILLHAEKFRHVCVSHFEFRQASMGSQSAVGAG